jgi:hypothetical protein
VFEDRHLFALDGSQFFSSNKIHCPHCCTKEKSQKSGEKKTEYSEYALPLTLVSASNINVIAAVDFITNTEHYSKQNCEIKAGKRLIEKNAEFLEDKKAIVLTDDLYSHQPFLSLIDSIPSVDYIATCKEASHKTVFEYVNGVEFANTEGIVTNKNGTREKIKCSWLEDVPIVDLR